MKKLEKFDKILFITILSLLLFGVIMVLSTSMIFAYQRFNSPYSFFVKQVIWMIIGFGFMYFTLGFKQKAMRKFSRFFYFILTAVLFALLFFGKEINGAKRWFDIGFVTFQPSEFMKVAMILFMADYIDRKKSKLQTHSGFLNFLFIIGVPLVLILLQPDLGGVIVLVAIIISMFFVAGLKLKYLLLVILLGLSVVPVEIMRKPFRRERMKEYISQFIFNKNNITDNVRPLLATEINSQHDASMVALERGGWLGTGPGRSRLKLFYLPEPHTDFIFAIIGEEWGYLGSIVVIGLFVLLFMRGLKISMNSSDFFSSLTAMGIAVYFSVQSAFHIGVSCGLFPTKGLTLPFISFGGSSLIVSMTAAGVLLNISGRLNPR